MPLLSEMKQRNVFKVAVAYLIVAWLLVQVASLILPQLALPDWTPTLVTVLLILGFPVALLLAWAYELTPTGIQRVSGAERSEDSPEASHRRLNYLIAGLALIGLAAFVGGRFLHDESSPTTLRIAVLPFDNLSESAEDAYFAAGLHEEVLNQLAKLSGLAVISRSSVLQYADARPSVPEIARDLNASAVVEASVRYAGDQLMVTVQLIDASTDTHMLSETYQASRSDASEIFSVQASIATEIARELGARIAPAERSALDRVPTESIEAYARYLRAQELINEASFGAAMVQLDQAVALDADFAEPYAERAYLYAYSQVVSVSRGQLLSALDVDPDEYQDLAVENANRALELFPSSGVAWTARALNHVFHFRWTSARAAFDRALELSPNEPDVLREYGLFLNYLGEHDRALELLGRAAALDPWGALTATYLSQVQAAAGFAADAAATLRRALSRDPDAPMLLMLAGVYEAEASVAEERLRSAEMGLGEYDEIFLPGIAAGYFRLGLQSDANRALERYEQWAQTQDVGAGWMLYHLLRGNPAEALRFLERAVERAELGFADPGFIALVTLRQLTGPLADDRRFIELTGRLEALKSN